jgi:TRAP-type C4-dicarboxylate transport system permease small subunit
VLYSICSLIEYGSIVVAGYFYFTRVKSEKVNGLAINEGIIYVVAVLYMYLLNILSVVVQNSYLKADS